jgi:glucose 1-dehydrogenase
MKAALVTGASSGIGQGTAIVLAKHGYDLAITYGRNADGAQLTKVEIEKLGRRCFVYQAFLEKENVAEEIVRRGRGDLGALTLLVNNAGRDSRNSILTATREDLQNIVDTNFIGYLVAAGEAARIMVRDGVAGSIHFVTSTRGESAHPDDFVYGGIKAAINRAAQSLAMELGLYNIRVNCIAPGATRVRPNRPPVDAKPGELINGRPYYPIEDAIPLHRMGVPADTGELVAFLASDKATYITGMVIRVDGGLVLPGQPEGYAPSYWYNPEWIQRHYDAMMARDKEDGKA